MTTSPTFLDRALHAVADPARRRILAALKEKTPTQTSRMATKPGSRTNCLCAGEIEERMQLSQSTISHHMAILTKAGLVEAEKQGQWRWYRRNEKALRKMAKSLRAQL